MNLNLVLHARPAVRIDAVSCAFGARGGMGQAVAGTQAAAPPGALMSQAAS